MGSLQGPVICRTVRAKQVGVYTVPVNGPLMKARLLRSGFWGFKGVCADKKMVNTLSHQRHVRKCRTPHCTFSSSSDGNGSMAENFNENDEDYVNSSVVEAVEVKSGADGFIIKMRDGRHLRCVHNNPQGGHMPDYAPHPAIVLKMEDGTGLLLPIIVLEMPSVLLMAAVRNVQIARPTLYQVIKEMIDKMGYAVKLVRVTKRVHEAYFAQLYLTKVGDASESVSFDLRPSDAINIAVRCKLAFPDAIYLVDVSQGGQMLMKACFVFSIWLQVAQRCGYADCLFFDRGARRKRLPYDYISFVGLLADPRYCGISYLEKEEVRVLLRQDPDFWTYRPLSELMVRAAADDVRFLLHIYHKMMEKLDQRSLLYLAVHGALYCRCFCISDNDFADWPSLPPIPDPKFFEGFYWRSRACFINPVYK